MRAAVIVFPGSNCDRDMRVALERAGADVTMVWHKDEALPDVDLVAIPGGFSFGDYLRCGAIAARAPVMEAVGRHIARGGFALGVCNGFQVLCEAGHLPGVLMRNARLTFVCRDTALTVGETRAAFLSGYRAEDRITLPVAHHDGNYRCGEAMAERLAGEGRVAFRYAMALNGSEADIAGVLSENGRVLGMMPHPERAVDPATGGTDGAALFESAVGALASA